MNNPTGMPGAELQLRKEIDRACLAFEDAWGDGPAPSLEAELARFRPAGRPALFRELLRIELEILRGNNQQPLCAEYESRFPDLSAIVREVWEQESSDGSGDSNNRQRGAGRYTILRDHAQGGLGQVYVARDEELLRDVALKEMQSQHVGDREVRARFLQEAKITGALEHPGIVPVYSLGTNPDGSPYYAMRFIQGESLKEAINRLHGLAISPAKAPAEPTPPAACELVADDLPSGKADADSTDRDQAAPRRSVSEEFVEPWNRTSDVSDHGLPRAAYSSFEFRQLLLRFVYVCRVIDYAHSRGVLHRDLKPGNIMLGKYGETMVVDWGLARRLDQLAADEARDRESTRDDSDEATRTSHGTALGTPSYMSPEQAEGRHDRLSPASDVYSLGATLYHLLTGRPPIVGRDNSERLQRAKSSMYPRVRFVQPAIPMPLASKLCQYYVHGMSRLVAAGMLLVAASATAVSPTLRRTDGAPATLALGGRPAILFYEDRASHAWNQPLKNALFAQGRARGMIDSVRVIAVANIAAYDFFPAREIAMRYVRRLEERVGVPILLDLDGVLTRPPWSLPADGAAVVVIDARGKRVLERRGRLTPDDVAATVAALERLVAEGAP